MDGRPDGLMCESGFLQEIRALYERQGWLVVESVEQIRRITKIQQEVEGFAVLQRLQTRQSTIL